MVCAIGALLVALGLALLRYLTTPPHLEVTFRSPDMWVVVGTLVGGTFLLLRALKRPMPAA